MTSKQRQDSSSHARVAHPAVVKIQQTATSYPDIHQIDVLSNIAFIYHLLHLGNARMESQCETQDSHQGWIVLTGLDHTETLRLVKTSRNSAQNVLPNAKCLHGNL